MIIKQYLHTKLILLAIVVAVVLPHSEAFQSSLSSSCLSIRTSHLLRAEEHWTGEAFQSSLSSSCLSIRTVRRTSHLRAEEQWTGEVVAGKWVVC